MKGCFTHVHQCTVSRCLHALYRYLHALCRCTSMYSPSSELNETVEHAPPRPQLECIEQTSDTTSCGTCNTIHNSRHDNITTLASNLQTTELFRWDDWSSDEMLAHGRYGKVQIHTNKTTGTTCVIKSQYENTRTQLEVTCLAACHHPNIVKYKGHRIHNGRMQLAMEHCPGIELFDYIIAQNNKNVLVELHVVRQVMNQLLEVVRYLHDDLHMMHRDIKPENIIFDPTTKHIQLVDFGFACTDNYRMSYVGTPYYTACEIVRGVRYTRLVDEGSTGVVMYIIMYGIAPFEGNEQEIFLKILRTNVSFPSNNRSDDVVECIRRLLHKTPSERATAAEILQHPWFASARDADAYTSAR